MKEATLADSLSSTAASVSESVSGFFRSLFYRCAVACLPCWEILSALGRISLRSASSKKVNGCGGGEAAGAAEADLAASEAEDGSAVIGGRRQASDSVTLLNEGGKDYGSANGAGASAVGIRALSYQLFYFVVALNPTLSRSRWNEFTGQNPGPNF